MRFPFKVIEHFEDCTRNWEYMQSYGVFNGDPTAPNAGLEGNTPLVAGGDLAGTYPNPTVAATAFGRTAARAYRSAALTLTASNYTKIPLDTVSFNPSGLFDITTNHRYNVPTTGYYQVNYSAIAFVGAPFTSVLFGPHIYVNGTVYSSGNAASASDAASYVRAQGNDIVSASASDYIELFVYATGGWSLYVGGTSTYNFLSVVRVG